MKAPKLISNEVLLKVYGKQLLELLQHYVLYMFVTIYVLKFYFFNILFCNSDRQKQLLKRHMFILKIQYIKNLDRLSNMIVEIIVFMFN